MKSLSFFKSATLFLLLLNLALIFFLFLGRPKNHPAKRNMMDKITSVLNLDQTQKGQFKELARAHNEAIEALNVESSHVLEPYFYNIFSKNNQLQKDSLMQHFQAIEKEKVEITRDHFREVKKILKPEQEKDFDVFLKKAVDVLLLDKKPSRKRH